MQMATLTKGYTILIRAEWTTTATTTTTVYDDDGRRQDAPLLSDLSKTVRLRPVFVGTYSRASRHPLSARHSVRQTHAQCQDAHGECIYPSRKGGAELASTTVKCHVREKVKIVDDLLYSQAACGSCFADGRSLPQLIHDLNNWYIDPLDSKFLILEVLEYETPRGGVKAHSLDNRRLHCLKQHQAYCRTFGWMVFVYVVATQVPSDSSLMRSVQR